MMPMEAQFAVHKLYLEAGASSHVDIAVDDQSRFSVNVFQCKGAEAYQLGPPKWERCSYVAHPGGGLYSWTLCPGLRKRLQPRPSESCGYITYNFKRNLNKYRPRLTATRLSTLTPSSLLFIS